VLDDVSPPASLGGVAVLEAIAPLAVAMARDEASRLQAQLEAIQEVMARSEREAAAAVTSHDEAQAHLLGKFLERLPVHPSEDVLP
jgi:hypothetical protein